MRYMRWSYDDLLGLPADLIPVIIELMGEEAAEYERISEQPEADEGF